MKGLPLAAGVLGLLAGLAAPSLAQKPSPSPSPSPKKETPTYTGDDLDRLAGRTPGEAPKTVAPAPTPEAPSFNPDAPVKATPQGDSDAGTNPDVPQPAVASWSERAKALRDQVTQAEEHVKELDNQAQTLLWQYLQSTDTNEILRMKAEQQEILDQLPDAKKAVEDAQKALADFEREATQAGVPQSEIREKKNP